MDFMSVFVHEEQSLEVPSAKVTGSGPPGLSSRVINNIDVHPRNNYVC